MKVFEHELFFDYKPTNIRQEYSKMLLILKKKKKIPKRMYYPWQKVSDQEYKGIQKH